MAVGPWGGNSRFEDDGDYDGIKEIEIFSSDCIDSINVFYSKNGVVIDGGKHGGDGGSLTKVFFLLLSFRSLSHKFRSKERALSHN